MKKKSHKESVGKIALTVTSVLTVGLATSLIGVSIALYDSVEDLMNAQDQLEKAQITIGQQQDNYKTLKQEFLSIESKSQKLEKRQNELLSQLSEYRQDKKELEDKISRQAQEISNYKSQLNSSQSKSKSKSSQSESSQSKEFSGDWKRLTVVATAYSLHDDPTGSDGTPETATGTYPKEGRTIAVDPNVIPYGTKVYIPALKGMFIAEDTGGAIKGNKIDIYMSHGSKARQWGRQTIEIYVEK